jgi:hypothetical protein
MRASGRGEYDLDTDEGRRAYLSDRLSPPEDPGTVEPLPLEANTREINEHMAARLSGAQVVELEQEAAT